MAKKKNEPALHKPISLPAALPIFREIEKSNDRAAGIVAVSFVENNLAVVLLKWLRPLSDKEQEDIFTRQNSLLNSFDAKIQMADVLGIISGNGLADLRRLKRIRNLFAHKMEARTFENAEIKAECERLFFPRFIAWAMEIEPEKNLRKRFEDTAHQLAARFDMEASKEKPPGPASQTAYDFWSPDMKHDV
ncbi:MAG: hypothetical protein V4527_00640 [Pseudomonadota bacterium]